MECNDIDSITFTNVQKMHAILSNSKVSKNIRNQGETLFCWTTATSIMLRRSLNRFLKNFINLHNMDAALKRLYSDDFIRQLRFELMMIPIPKLLSNEYKTPVYQGRYLTYLDMVFERVSHLNCNSYLVSNIKTMTFEIYLLFS